MVNKQDVLLNSELRQANKERDLENYQETAECRELNTLKRETVAQAKHMISTLISTAEAIKLI